MALRLNLQHIAQIERLRKQLDRAIGEQLAAYPTTLTTIPGIGPVYAAYYEKKYNEVPKHKHKRAVTLTARKLVRLVVRLLTTNQPYQARRQEETTSGGAGERSVRRLARRPRP